MVFPAIKRYAVHLLPTSTGLAPAFDLLKRLDTGAGVSAPSVSELGQGWYYFDWTFATPNDPTVAFVLNGNAPAAIDPSAAMEGTLSTADLPNPSGNFPQVMRYGFHYLPGQTGLTPAFSLLKRLDTGADLAQPSIFELGGAGNGDGWYYFDWTFGSSTDPDVAFLINGNAPGAIDPSVATYGIISLSNIAAPLVAPPPSPPFVTPNPLATVSVSGVDFGQDFDFLSLLNPSMSLVGGHANLGQALAHRLETPRGSLFYDLNYGYDVRDFANDSMTQAKAARAAAGAQAECLNDERVLSCVATAQFDQGSSNFTLTLSVLTSSGPFQFVLAVTSVSVALLEPIVQPS